METLTTLQAVFEKAGTPQDLQIYLTDTLKLASISDLVGYTEREHYEREWRELIVGVFPVVAAREARAAVPASEGVAAQLGEPAVSGFTAAEQRLLVSRMRTTYRIAMGAEHDEEEEKKAAKQDAYQADMEKPLDPETRKRLRKQWQDLHAWQPVASMKAAPKLRNRVVREFLGKCVTNHTVEKCVTSLQAKRPVEPERLPIGPTNADAALIYEREKPQTRTVATLLDYLSCLRLLMGTYAYCGSHWVDSKVEKGTKVFSSRGKERWHTQMMPCTRSWR